MIADPSLALAFLVLFVGLATFAAGVCVGARLMARAFNDVLGRLEAETSALEARAFELANTLPPPPAPPPPPPRGTRDEDLYDRWWLTGDRPPWEGEPE